MAMRAARLMRDLPLAASLIEATVKAVKVPVTVKMRMGWDHSSLNAPRTRPYCRGFGRASSSLFTAEPATKCIRGSADWGFVRKGKGGGESYPSSSMATFARIDDARDGAQTIGRGWRYDRARHLWSSHGYCAKSWTISRAAPLRRRPIWRSQRGPHPGPLCGDDGPLWGTMRASPSRANMWAGIPRGLRGSAEFRNTVNTIGR